MSKVASFDRFRDGLSDWVSQASQADLAEPSPAARVGSWLLRQSGSEHEIYLKTANTAAEGWTRQNYDLRIFNVKDYGAIGDGLANDRMAVQNAINDASTAGGGIVYFPPGEYAIYKVNAATPTMLDVTNKHGITFLGDGMASQVRMAGDQGDALSILFLLRNSTHAIQFRNLFMDAALASNTSEQNHLIQIEGLATDPAGSGAHDIDIVGCYFGEAVGDAVRLAGNDLVPVTNVRIRANDFNLVNPGTGKPASRTCVSYQRGVGDTLISYNFMKGSQNGQQLDQEPTGTAPIFNNLIIGNQLDHQSQGSESLSIGGLSANLATHQVLAFNTVTNGGAWDATLTDATILVGNVVVVNSAANVVGAFLGQDVRNNMQILANVFNVDVSPATIVPFTLLSTTTSSLQVLISNNLIRSVNGGAPHNGAAIGDLDGVSQFVSTGNIWTGLASLENNTMVRLRTGSLTTINHAVFTGEVMVADSAGTQTSVLLLAASNADNFLNAVINNCYFRNTKGTGSVVEFNEGGGAVFTNHQYTGDNLLIGGTTASVILPPSNKGITLGGSAGPGTQIADVTLAAGPETHVAAVAGSLCCNPSGGIATTLFVKESGSGLSGGASGWFGVGTDEISFGVIDTGNAPAARFMATGSDLAAAKTTSIELRLPRPCTVRNWRVKQVAGTGAGTITYTVRKNNVPQSGPITVNFTATTGGPTGNFSAVAGDTISVVISKSATPSTAPTNAVFTLDIAG
jgi:hypothetical protein